MCNFCRVLRDFRVSDPCFGRVWRATRWVSNVQPPLLYSRSRGSAGSFEISKFLRGFFGEPFFGRVGRWADSPSFGIYIFHIPIQNDWGDSETPTKTQEKTSLAARWHSLTFILWWLTPALLIDFPSNRNFWNQSFLVQKGQSPAMPFRSLRKDRKMVPRWTWGKKIWVDRSSESQTFV